MYIHTHTYIYIHIISYHVMSCHVMSYHIMSYPILSYHIISYRIMPYHIISYHMCVYVCMYVCMYIYIYIYIHIHMCVYTPRTQGAPWCYIRRFARDVRKNTVIRTRASVHARAHVPCMLFETKRRSSLTGIVLYYMILHDIMYIYVYMICIN